MSSPLGNAPVRLAPGTRILVRPDGNVALYLDDRELTATIEQFPWEILLSLCVREAVPTGKILQVLGDAGVAADLARDIVDELLENQVLLVDNGCLAASHFHRVSSFGRFPESVVPGATVERDAGSDGEDGRTSPRMDLLAKPLSDTLRLRRTRRDFGCGHLGEDRLMAMLWAAYGCVTSGEEAERRTVPSAGGVYPFRLVVLAMSVEGVPTGLYEYMAKVNTLQPLPVPLEPQTVNTWFRTPSIDYQKAAAVVFLVGSLDRICPRYGERGYRYLLLEAGHIAQNICLAATALQLAHVPVGGFDDDLVNSAACRLDRRELTVYGVVLGRP